MSHESQHHLPEADTDRSETDPLGEISRPTLGDYGRRAMALAGYAAGVSAVALVAHTPTWPPAQN